ncbi:MAG: S9 family peptidase, partial [Acidobacteriota bacterium]
MRKTFLILSFAVWMFGLRFTGTAQAPAPAGYLTPPKIISDIMDAEPLPGVSLSPDRTVMLLSHRRSMPTIAEVSAPFYRLAGYRINPRTNGMRVLNGPTSLTLKDVASGAERNLALPPGGTYGASFSPDGKKIAITITTSNSIQLYLADVATAQVKPVLTGGINGLGGGCGWLDDSSGFLCRLIPEGRGPEPKDPAVPTGPTIQENAGRVAPSATYEDLLKNPYDESLYEYYFTSQLAWVDLTGKKTAFGKPAIYAGADVSRDGSWLVVTRIKHPFSYVVPAGDFPRDVELWDKTGKFVRRL